MGTLRDRVKLSVGERRVIENETERVRGREREGERCFKREKKKE